MLVFEHNFFLLGCESLLLQTLLLINACLKKLLSIYIVIIGV